MLRRPDAILDHLHLGDMLMLREVTALKNRLGFEPCDESPQDGVCSECAGVWLVGGLATVQSEVPTCQLCGHRIKYTPSHTLAEFNVRWLHNLVKRDIPVPHEAWWDFWMALRVLAPPSEAWEIAPTVWIRGKSIDPDLPTS